MGGAGIVIARAVVRDLCSGVEAARLFSLLMLVTGVAPVLAPLLGGQLIKLTSWRGIFGILVAIGLVLLVAALTSLPETHETERQPGVRPMSTLATFGILLRDRAFVGYALAGALVYGALFAYIAGSPFVLQNVYGVSPQVFSGIFAVNAVGLVVAAQFSRNLARRTGPVALLRSGQTMTALGGLGLMAAVFLGWGLIAVLPSLFLVMSSVGLVSPNATALALNDHPTAAGSAAAVLGAIQLVLGGRWHRWLGSRVHNRRCRWRL